MAKNGLERTLDALSGRATKDIPVALHNFLFAAKYIGLDFNEGLKKGELLAEAQLAVFRDFGHDCLQMENGVAAMAEAIGCKIRYSEEQPPHVEERVLDNLLNIDNLSIPDPERTFPLSENLKCTRIVVREIGARAFVMGRADQGPMALAYALAGPENFLTNLMDPKMHPVIRKILQFCTDCMTAYALAQKHAGAHGTSIGGAGTSLISPKMYRDWELPYEKKWIHAVQKPDFKTFLHICEDETLILHDMISSGADCLELDPGTPYENVRKALEEEKRSAVLGMVDVKRVLPFGTEKEVFNATREAIEVISPTGRLIVGPGCALPANTPPENVHALIEAARSYCNT
jgi:uroporphyrinogen decarboxylase